MDVPRTLRTARVQAGLSQAKLARLAKTSQPAIARYETGVTTPSLPTLQRLLDACGRDLGATEAAATEAKVAARKSAAPRERLRTQRRRILAASRRHGIRHVHLFGSAARRTNGPDSDVDLLVELAPGRSLLDMIGFQQEAADILGMRVDVATTDILKPGVRGRALRDARPL